MDGKLTEREKKYFRWCYAAIVELAKEELAASSREIAEGGEDCWPGQMTWEELGGSSKSVFLCRARERLDIDHDDFLLRIRSGEVEVDDLYGE